ncbi:hypothetical protein TNIN_147351 [Trichonephila inaurata madagascariensis]|uniref:Transmembrane protein n=1 Tax=Trichonephila inaurata madagascariensis TaxID=2747483 RepID=A0A8X6YW03_9ARAC|nr:hypothetical protein TNIN_147351 [Trichonephila inaurata madagascariensis]
MSELNKEEQQDFRYRLFGLSGFIIFLLIGILALIFALDVHEHVLALSITSAASICIAVTCCIWVSFDKSKRQYRVPEEESLSEEIDLEEMALAEREYRHIEKMNYLQRFGTGLGVQTYSRGSSISDGYIDQEAEDLLKRIQSSKAAAAEDSSNDEKSIIVTVADIHSVEDTTESSPVESSDQMSTYSAEEAKSFRLNQLPFIDMKDSEEILPEVFLPSSSDDEVGTVEKETSGKEV